MAGASTKKRLYPEVVWFRGVAALAVVIIHSLSRTQRLHSEIDLSWFLMALMFATPVFVFISEYLFSQSYPRGLPQGFYRRRIQYLLLPYVTMGVAYAIYDTWGAPVSEVVIEALGNIFLGKFVGYFVLVIFQFYLLHHVFHRFLRQAKPIPVLVGAFGINAAYLAFFNLFPQPPGVLGAYIWHRGYWLLAVGWIFYFALGYYAGRNRDRLLDVIARHRVAVIALCGGALALTYLGLASGVFRFVSSKRPELLIYAPAVIGVLMLLSTRYVYPPKFLLFISNYSFSIYLLHWFVINNMKPVHSHPMVATLGFIISGLVFAIGVAKLVNLLPWGRYLVGRPYGQTQGDYHPPAGAHIR